MSVDLVDELGTEIRATIFNDAVDKFSPLLEVGRVYIVSRGRVKAANRQYSMVNNDYEITLDSHSVVELVQVCRPVESSFALVPMSSV